MELVWALVDSEFADKLAPVLIEAAKQGITVTLTSGYRSPTYQRELYDAWIKSGKPGLPVAPPGLSYHNYGLAIDLVPGERIGQIAEKFGLRWGGRFTPTADPVHVDYATKYTLSAALKAGFPHKLVCINAKGSIQQVPVAPPAVKVFPPSALPIAPEQPSQQDQSQQDPPGKN